MVIRMEQIIGIGAFLAIIGFVIVFIGAMMGANQTDSKTKIAVGGFIGPIPFGFSNDKNILWFLVIESIALLLMWIILSHRIMN